MINALKMPLATKTVVDYVETLENMDLDTWYQFPADTYSNWYMMKFKPPKNRKWDIVLKMQNKKPIVMKVERSDESTD